LCSYTGGCEKDIARGFFLCSFYFEKDEDLLRVNFFLGSQKARVILAFLLCINIRIYAVVVLGFLSSK
jgi:hypothetical protein